VTNVITKDLGIHKNTDFNNEPFQSEVIWNIYIQENNKSFKHKIKVKINNVAPQIPSFKTYLRIPFAANQAISDCQADCTTIADDLKYQITPNDDGSKLFMCDLEQIISRNPVKLTNKLSLFSLFKEKKPEILISFKQDNVIDDLGPMFLVDLTDNYVTSGLNPSNVVVNIYLPITNFFVYIIRVLSSSYKNKWRIFEVFNFKEEVVDRWNNISGFRRLYLSYVNKNNSLEFPKIGFGYKPTNNGIVSKLLYSVFMFIAGVLSSFLANRIRPEISDMLINILKSLGLGNLFG